MPTTRFPLGEIMAAEQDVRSEAREQWRCAGCVYFYPHTQDAPRELNQGMCRRYPPEVIPFPSGDGYSPRQVDGPIVYGDYRCGEYLAANVSLRGVEL